MMPFHLTRFTHDVTAQALIISITGFLSTSGSSILVPASTIIAARFDEPNKQLVTLTTAIYVLGLGVGPFLFAPLSELKGRYFAYSSSMVGFTLLNLACNFAPTCVTSRLVLSSARRDD